MTLELGFGGFAIKKEDDEKTLEMSYVIIMTMYDVGESKSDMTRWQQQKTPVGLHRRLK